jgi:DNA-directed RNA polymerase specialized sigma24 family protein
VSSNVPRNAWNDAGTVQQVYLRYRAELRHFFSIQASGRYSVDDLMQEVFLRLLQAKPSQELDDVQQFIASDATRPRKSVE